MTVTRKSPPYCPPSPEALQVLHIDADIIIVDKPAGLLSVPGRGAEKAVCAQQILDLRHGGVFTVHRLDMDTSGLMVFARNKDAQRFLSIGFERRLGDKQYEAVVEGQMEEERGIIDLPISRHSLQRPLRHIDPEGQAAVTEWQVVERTATTTRLLLTPKTGRTHQLRLHLSATGHAILGDPFYGDPSSSPRLLLHATALTLLHPDGSGPASFVSVCPF